MKEKIIRFFKQETVLCAAFALAAVSIFFVHPDKEYLGYGTFGHTFSAGRITICC